MFHDLHVLHVKQSQMRLCNKEKKHLLLCAIIFVQVTLLSSRNDSWGIPHQNRHLGILHSLGVFWNSVRFLLNVSVTNSFLRGAALLLLRILYMRLIDETNKNSSIGRSFSLCSAFARQGSITSEISLLWERNFWLWYLYSRRRWMWLLSFECRFSARIQFGFFNFLMSSGASYQWICHDGRSGVAQAR